MARAAARLMAVVVFPTPPFWFAIAMTIKETPRGKRSRARQRRMLEEATRRGSSSNGCGQPAAPHRYILYLPRSSSESVLEPLLEAPTSTVSWLVSTLRALWITASSTKIRGPCRSASAIASEGRASTSTRPARWTDVERGVERVLLELADHDALDAGLRARSITFFSRSCVIGRGVWTFSIWSAMALASKTPTQIGQDPLALGLAEDDDRHVRDGVDHQPLDGHLDFHAAPTSLLGAEYRSRGTACQ